MPKTTNQQIAQLQSRIQELEDKWKRALADYTNLKRHTEEERADFVKFAGTLIILKLLPVLENLDKVTDYGSQSTDQGLELIKKQFRDILKTEGVEEITAAGQEFDPHYHEAVEIIPSDQDNKVVAVLSPGWVMHGRVIRPAKVKVGKQAISNKQ
ncbi:nucleotide exchange factor GrpE [Candidatus Daviesbacteria bacterium]|nr:nucleotide exchange factor GrpE [Candidatus Daviesbacteria bacterium]